MPYAFTQPRMQLRNKDVLIYFEPQYTHSKNHYNNCLKLQNFKEAETYSGKMTTHTAKRMRKAISLFVQSSQTHQITNTITNRRESFKINFITLTIPSTSNNVSLKEGYKLLMKPFLQWLTKSMKVHTYIWKAELQQRGQLHYHITTNTWLHHQRIRIKWNYLLNKNNLLKEYIKKTGNNNPNSTDVHKVYRIKNFEAYLAKEFSKNIQTDHKQPGKIWDCSTNLKGLNYFTVDLTEQHERLILSLHNKQNLREWQNQHCTILKGQKNLSSYVLTRKEFASYLQFLEKINRKPNLQLS